MARMRRLPLALLLLALVAGLGWFVYPNLQQLTTLPYDNERSLVYLSRAAVGAEGEMYVIADSRQEILEISGDGELLRQVKQQAGDGRRHDYTEIAATGDGSVVVIDTVLDGYGLYVQEERIILYPPGADEGRVLYSFEGSGSNKRIGQVKGLAGDGEHIYFYIDEETGVSLNRVGLAGGNAEEVYRFALPENRYVSEIVGHEPGQIHYSTKRGSIYHVAADGSSKKIYPLDDAARTSRNFPEALQLHGENVYFIDRLVNAVMSIGAAGNGALRAVMNEEQLADSSGGAEYLELMDIAVDAGGHLTAVLDDRLVSFPLNGGSGAALSTIAEGRDAVRLGWLTWGAAALFAIAVVLLLRFIYVHVLRRRVSLFFKQVVAIVPILTLAMFMLSNFIYNSFSERMEDEMQRQLTLLARNGQTIIDGDALERLATPDDYMNEDYKGIRDKMNFLYENEDPANRKGLYSTLYKYDGGELFIMMDDDDGVNMFRPFPLSDDNRPVLEQGEVLSGRWEDATGKWLYAIGPVYNSDGEVVGVYETGRDLNVLYHSNETIYRSIVWNIGLISCVLLALVLGVTYWLLASLRKLRRSVMEMADGNWDVKVHIRSQDEVGDLGEQFNRMAQHIRTYIGDITAFSEASHRFVPQQFFKYLGKKGITEVHLGDQVQQNMAVMVANIRRFDGLSKQLTPKQNFDFMNGFLKRFSPFVRQEEGLVSKYLGAGFMALFPGRADDAMRAAVAIRRELASYNDSLLATGFKPVELGIALHRGPLMLGIVGEEQRMEGNVISDTVNVTAALERMSDSLGASILVTSAFFDQLRAPERFRHRHLGRIGLDGKAESIELIDVYEGDSELERALKDRTKGLFEEGIALCQEGRFFDAREAFIEVIKINRFDKAAKLYFYLCDEYYQKGSSEGWDGTLAV